MQAFVPVIHDHFYLHNIDTMKRALEKCGFQDVRNVNPGETKLKELEKTLYDAEFDNGPICFHVEAVKRKNPLIEKYAIKLPNNIIKKIIAMLFNISISPYNKRKPMFPNAKWFFEKYLKLKQYLNKNR